MPLPDDVLNPTARFTDRVAAYVKYRPSYPVEVVTILEDEAQISPEETRVVDLGSGTGISAALFLDRGYRVVGVEPNAAMRKAALAMLGNNPKFQMVDGRAEAVPLPAHCCELVLVAQAFHWFDQGATRREMQRIMVPEGVLALAWNERRLSSTPFLRAYEALLQRSGTDYGKVSQQHQGTAHPDDFFGPSGCITRTVASYQDFDWDGLRGRALSSSYVPQDGAPGHAAFMTALAAIYREHAVAGLVRFEYDTRLHFGGLA